MNRLVGLNGRKNPTKLTIALESAAMEVILESKYSHPIRNAMIPSPKAFDS